ncbi:MAG: ParM/StbA family protein [Bacillota bacterium]|nr:ParM/StbA family protein [Bacillota bacterium]
MALVVIGIDLGYGRVKVAARERRPFDLAAAWAPAPQADWGLGRTRPVFVDGRAYVIGDAAEARPGARRPFGTGLLASADALPLLGAALWLAGADGDVALGTGTPLGAFMREREAAREALEGRAIAVGDGRRERRVVIRRLALQPEGVAAAAWLAASGRLPRAPGYGAVLDVGTRTLDVLALELSRLEPLPELSFTEDLGLASAAEALAGRIEAELGSRLPPDLALRALREPVTWNGRQVGGPDGANWALDGLAELIRDAVARRLGGEAGRVRAWAAVGGGSIALGQRLDGILPGERARMTEREAIFANAMGFALAAERAATRLAARSGRGA